MSKQEIINTGVPTFNWITWWRSTCSKSRINCPQQTKRKLACWGIFHELADWFGRLLGRKKDKRLFAGKAGFRTENKHCEGDKFDAAWMAVRWRNCLADQKSKIYFPFLRSYGKRNKHKAIFSLPYKFIIERFAKQETKSRLVSVEGEGKPR